MVCNCMSKINIEREVKTDYSQTDAVMTTVTSESVKLATLVHKAASQGFAV